MFLSPQRFKALPHSFPEGHAQYVREWEHLFLYETFTSIVNSKRGIEEKNIGDNRNRGKVYQWPGFMIKGTEGKQFLTARLYDQIPALTNVDTTNSSGHFSPVRHVKEGDLLLLSSEDLLL